MDLADQLVQLELEALNDQWKRSKRRPYPGAVYPQQVSHARYSIGMIIRIRTNAKNAIDSILCDPISPIVVLQQADDESFATSNMDTSTPFPGPSLRDTLCSPATNSLSSTPYFIIDGLSYRHAAS